MGNFSITQLARSLHGVGKANFIRFFDVFRDNYYKLNRYEIGELLLKQNPNLDKKDSTPRMASYAIAIFKRGQEWEVLQICADSPRVGKKYREQAKLLLEKYNSDFEVQVLRSMADDNDVRRERLAKCTKIPEKVQIQSHGYKRNRDVVAEVRLRANGKCESCGNDAPFISVSGGLKGLPFLEVHHKKWLSENGEDSVKNAVALCPNCHRREHFGKRKWLK